MRSHPSPVPPAWRVQDHHWVQNTAGPQKKPVTGILLGGHQVYYHVGTPSAKFPIRISYGNAFRSIDCSESRISMNAFADSGHHRKLAFVFSALFILCAVRLWPHKSARTQNPAAPTGTFQTNAPGDGTPPSGPDSAPWQRMNAVLQKLPAQQRKFAEERMRKDQAFFASLRDLPQDQRQQKIQEYLAKNPPQFPPQFDGPPPTGAPGQNGEHGPGFDDPGQRPMHLPPPEVRHSMDQQIANTQKQGGS